MQIKTIYPATGKVLDTYTIISADECDELIVKAQTSFLSWRCLSLDERISIVRKLADELEQQKQACAELISLEMGKPIKFSIMEIDKCRLVCQKYIDHAKEYLAPQAVKTEFNQSFVVHNPLGIILAVMPWNFPFWQFFRFLIPNLIVGNVVLLKHASNVTGCAKKIESICLDAGLPPFVMTHLSISANMVADVVAHPLVRGVTLTGSDDVGRKIAEVAGRHLKKISLELGGNDAAIIMADANLKDAAKSILASRLRNSGQVCVSSKRIIVDKTIEASFTKHLLEEINIYQMQDPLLPTTIFGPLARADLRVTIHSQVQEAIRQGAKLLHGGFIPQGQGYFYPPTVLSAVDKNSIVYAEELFGPVIAISSYASIEEAIDLANATRFGLGASVYGQDMVLVQSLLVDKMEAGLCYGNMPVTSDPRFPFGGIKDSGYGRELGREGIYEFTNVKTVIIDAK